MKAIPVSDLDTYSRLALPMILAKFPDWEQFAVLAPRTDGAGSTVDFNLPCPSVAADHGLWVSTAGEELTVGFHTHHNHFTDYEEARLNPVQIEAGLDHIRDSLCERIGVVSWYRDSAFAASQTIALPYLDPLPRPLAGLGLGAKADDMFAGCHRATLRSWRGRFDRDEDHGSPLEEYIP